MKTYTTAAPMSRRMRRILKDPEASAKLFDQLIDKGGRARATVTINGDRVTVSASPVRPASHKMRK
jgi:regulator of extracellular matrix RemA (YlzA/DUF370 family)